MHSGMRCDGEKARIAAIILVFITVCAYLPVIINGGFIWDDGPHLTRNVLLWNAGGLWRIWFDLGATHAQYYPLTYTTFWLEYRLWDLWPTGYHIVNVFLHAGNAVVLWYILRILAVPGAWFIAAVFALHPIHVESTAWITERKNVLSGFFYLISLLCYLRFSPSLFLLGGDGETRCWSYYCLSLFFFICALFSKTVTCSLPAAILLVAWWKQGKLSVKDLFLLIPMFVIGLGMALVTAGVEEGVVGAVGNTWSLSLVEKILLAGRALWFYAGKLVWPFPISFLYPRWDINASVPWQYLFPSGIIGLVLFFSLWARKRSRAPIATILFFCGTLVPALGFFNVYFARYSYVADHFQYLASIGIFALIGGYLWGGKNSVTISQEGTEMSLYREVRETLRRSPYSFFISLGVLLVLGSVTWQRGYVYENAKTLWLDTIQKTPSSWMPYNNLGVIAITEGDFLQATAYFEEAVKRNPQSAQSHMNLCSMYKRLGKLDVAIQHGKQAISLWPDWGKPYKCVAEVFMTMGEHRKAAEYFRAQIERDPQATLVYHNAG